MSKIKVIVVDDSALMRRIVSDMINSQPDMEVIEKARDGKELIKKLLTHKPDVITLDVEMPNLNGVETLKELKKLNISVSVVMVSSLTEKGAKVTFECLENGAFDFVQKPSGSISLDIGKVKDEIIKKIRLAAINNNSKLTSYSANNKVLSSVRKNIEVEKKVYKKNNIMKEVNGIEAVVIGASTGGPKALYELITKLPGNLDVPVFIVQHMPVGFTEAFAKRLDKYSNLKVVEAYDGCKIEKNTVYVAKGGQHMQIKNKSTIELNEEKTVWGVRPAADNLFISAANVYKDKLLSIVLTGMGKDGAKGSEEIKNKGGYTISESEETCTIYGMPKSAFLTGKIDEVLPLYEIGNRITELLKAM